MSMCNPSGENSPEVGLHTSSSPVWCPLLFHFCAVSPHVNLRLWGYPFSIFSPPAWCFHRSHSNFLSLAPSLPPTSIGFKDPPSPTWEMRFQNLLFIMVILQPSSYLVASILLVAEIFSTPQDPAHSGNPILALNPISHWSDLTNPDQQSLISFQSSSSTLIRSRV